MFDPRLIQNFFLLLALIVHERGIGNKEIENQPSKPKLKNFDLNLILTCNKLHERLCFYFLKM